ncbi:MAG: M28 family peptidase [Anaerolineae bacterium]
MMASEGNGLPAGDIQGLEHRDIDRAADEALGHARYLCDEIGPRPVGSANDAAAARYVQDQLSQMHLGDPRIEEFTAPASAWRPHIVAFSVAILGIGLWALMGGSVFGTYLAAIACGFALWEFYAEMNFGWSPLAAFTPKRPSQNVVATVAPAEGEGRNAIVFAHVDTQRTPFYARRPGLLRLWYVCFYLAAAVLTLTLVAMLVSWFASYALPLWAGLPLVVVAVLAVALLVETELTPFTKGANDNASSVGVALAVARHFGSAPMRNTRLWVVFTSAEESGCHGAGAFLEAHDADLLQGYVVDLEGVGVNKPAYSTREGMLRRYRSNPELVRLAERLSRSDPSLGLRPTVLRGGFTETGIAIKRGMRSICLAGVDESGLMPYWHTQADTSDKLNREALGATYAATVGILRRLDDLPTSIKLSAIKPLRER